MPALLLILTERWRASSEAALEITLRQTEHEESKNFTIAASEMQTPSSFPSSKKHLVFQKQSVSADVQLWPVLLLWCLRSVIIFDSLCSMADGLFLVALNLQNANRKIIKCGAVEARCYVHANEGSTTNNVQRVGKSRCWRNGLILLEQRLWSGSSLYRPCCWLPRLMELLMSKISYKSMINQQKGGIQVV